MSQHFCFKKLGGNSQCFLWNSLLQTNSGVVPRNGATKFFSHLSRWGRLFPRKVCEGRKRKPIIQANASHIKLYLQKVWQQDWRDILMSCLGLWCSKGLTGSAVEGVTAICAFTQGWKLTGALQGFRVLPQVPVQRGCQGSTHLPSSLCPSVHCSCHGTYHCGQLQTHPLSLCSPQPDLERLTSGWDRFHASPPSTPGHLNSVH